MPKKKQNKKEPIRVGVLGLGRGQSFMQGAGPLVGMELTAICDQRKEPLEKVAAQYGVAAYTDYEAFLNHPMDAVILANYFHEHAPFAIQALRAGKHVMSECTCNATLAEGVELCRTVEETGCIYMLAENYPYTVFNMEMRRLYREGEIGEVTYADGEYNHPMSEQEWLPYSPGMNHWRAWMPSTYYCTHALAPLMTITGARPVQVNALSIAWPEGMEKSVRVGDPGSVILCRMDNGAVFRLFGLHLPGHSNWYRLHGTRGGMEIARGAGYYGPEQIRIWHEHFDVRQGEPRERSYVPDWPEHGDLAQKAGHGGGDFWTCFEFANAIRSGKQPFLDVYRGVAMSSVGILAWKSALQDGTPVSVPNFKKEKERKHVEDDHCSPFPSHQEKGWPAVPPSIHGVKQPSSKAVQRAKKFWKGMGYEE